VASAVVEHAVGQGDGKENFGHNDYPHRLKLVPHLSRRRPKYSSMPVNRI
jgi:hypothetical protein